MAADYWKQRAERDMDAAQEAAAERLVRISRACRQASQDLAAQVEKIIGTYAKRFKLTRAEALEALRAPFDEDSRAYAYRLTRAEALARAVKEQTDKLRALEEGELDKLWQQTSQTAAGNAQSMLEALNFDRPDLHGERMALDTGWSGQSYSSRIWNSTDRLAQVLEKEITAAYLSGKTNRTIAQEIADRFSAAYRDAERLVRTEASYVANRAAVEEYAQAGCRYVEFLTAKDSRTCPICAGHDGDIVPVGKAKTGSNIPPLHPNCRCTVLPVVDDDETQKAGYKPLTEYDFDAKIDVKVPPETKEIIDNAGKKVTRDFPVLDDYLYAVGFGDTGRDNPAAAFMSITADGRVGQMIGLNRNLWENIDNLKKILRSETAKGGHIRSESAEAIITHEYGHVAYNAAMLKSIGYNGSGRISLLQRQEIEAAMDNLNGMIRSRAGGVFLSARGNDSESEYVAEAFSDYYSGECCEASRQIIALFKELLSWDISMN